MICTNPDLIVDKGNKRELCAGSVAMVFEKMGGEVVYFGKPYPEVYNQSIDNNNKKILSIGDNLNTDIKGANLLNYDSLLISNGVHKDEIKNNGIERNEQWIKQGNFSFKSGFDAGVEIFHSEKIPTAIFASNDSMAAGIMKSAQMKGLQVPNDLSLAGFDDSPIAHQIWPALTTVKQPVEKMAAHAAKILIAKFDGLAEQTKSKEFKSELIVRESLKSL